MYVAGASWDNSSVQNSSDFHLLSSYVLRFLITPIICVLNNAQLRAQLSSNMCKMRSHRISPTFTSEDSSRVTEQQS